MAAVTKLFVGVSLFGPLAALPSTRIVPRPHLPYFMRTIAELDIDLTLFVLSRERDTQRLLYPFRSFLRCHRIIHTMESVGLKPPHDELLAVMKAGGGTKERTILITSDLMMNELTQNTLVLEKCGTTGTRTDFLPVDSLDYAILRSISPKTKDDFVLLAVADVLTELANNPNMSVSEYLSFHCPFVQKINAPMFGNVRYIPTAACTALKERMDAIIREQRSAVSST